MVLIVALAAAILYAIFLWTEREQQMSHELKVRGHNFQVEKAQHHMELEDRYFKVKNSNPITWLLGGAKPVHMLER